MMNAAQLKEYLSIVVDMEKECYLQERLRADLEYRISTLGNANYCKKPVKGSSELGTGILMSLAVAVIGFVIGYAVELFAELLFGWSWAIPIACAVIPGCGLLIVSVMSAFAKNDSYQKALQEYEQAAKADAERIQEEKKVRVYLTKELAALDHQMQQSRKTLQALYQKGIIFPKYRNFVMVASIYEYFCSGRCTTLEGHEGAYNILEMEIRLNHIVSQLDRIISQLEEIKNNQYMIYSAIQESNQKLSQILESSRYLEAGVRRLEVQGEELNARVAGLQAASALNLYLNELNHKELTYRNRMGLW